MNDNEIRIPPPGLQERLSGPPYDYVEAAHGAKLNLKTPACDRLLLIDDDIRTRTVLRLALKQRGFEVLEADDGFEGLEAYRRFGDSIAVALLGATLRGLSTPATFGALRELNPQICCCIMGLSMGTYRTEALQRLGAAAVFSKPLALNEVVETLSRLVHRPSPPPAG